MQVAKVIAFACKGLYMSAEANLKSSTSITRVERMKANLRCSTSITCVERMKANLRCSTSATCVVGMT